MESLLLAKKCPKNHEQIIFSGGNKRTYSSPNFNSKVWNVGGDGKSPFATCKFALTLGS